MQISSKLTPDPTTDDLLKIVTWETNLDLPNMLHTDNRVFQWNLLLLVTFIANVISTFKGVYILVGLLGVLAGVNGLGFYLTARGLQKQLDKVQASIGWRIFFGQAIGKEELLQLDETSRKELGISVVELKRAYTTARNQFKQFDDPW